MQLTGPTRAAAAAMRIVRGRGMDRETRVIRATSRQAPSNRVANKEAVNRAADSRDNKGAANRTAGNRVADGAARVPVKPPAASRGRDSRMA